MEGDSVSTPWERGNSGVLVLMPLGYNVQLRSLLTGQKITPFNQLSLEVGKDNRQMPFLIDLY